MENEWIDAPAHILDLVWKAAMQKAANMRQPYRVREFFGAEIADRCHPRGGDPR